MADLVNVAPFQGRLQVDSTTQVSLQRFNGAYIPLKISGTWEAKLIPASGPTLDTTGLSSSTKYYIYAFDSTGTLTLEASTTAYAVDGDTGVPIKNADASRTLVAVVFMDGSTHYGALGKATLNWWNRRAQVSQFHSTSFYTSLNNASYTEVSTTLRTLFICWADDIPEAVVSSSAGPLVAADTNMALSVNTTVQEHSAEYMGTAGASFARLTLHDRLQGITDETQHYVSLYAKSSATVYVGGNQTANAGSTTVTVTVQG